jgi:hypothetical protein
MEVSIGMHRCSPTPYSQIRRLDLIVMPILTLGFFCLRKFDAQTLPHLHLN